MMLISRLSSQHSVEGKRCTMCLTLMEKEKRHGLPYFSLQTASRHVTIPFQIAVYHVCSRVSNIAVVFLLGEFLCQKMTSHVKNVSHFEIRWDGFRKRGLTKYLLNLGQLACFFSTSAIHRSKNEHLCQVKEQNKQQGVSSSHSTGKTRNT